MYVRGRLPKKGIAIVGSRTPLPGAASFAYELAFGCGEPVISGLALGIDAAAHRGALDAGMPTVAFVGYGFGRTYPPEHGELEDRIVAAGGAIATECKPGTPVSDEGLIARDRLQAEYAFAVVLVSTEIGGGAMHTVRFAREFGRPVFACVPDPDLPVAYEGNADALRNGAIAIPRDPKEALAIIHARAANDRIRNLH
jgi:DNA processing protein